MRTVVYVTESGESHRVADWEEAHTDPTVAHAGLSLMLFNVAGEVLLQKRALHKRTFAGLWSNSCCTHPSLGEVVEAAAARRCREELGVEVRPVAVGSFLYRAIDERSEYVEFEQNTVLVAPYGGEIKPDPREVGETAWVATSEVARRCHEDRQSLTPWLEQVHSIAVAGWHALASLNTP